MEHVDALHVGVALAKLHRRPHAPQLFGSSLVCDSHPLVKVPSQLEYPDPHVKAHPPNEHTAFALGADGHARPHDPQLRASALSDASHPFEASPSQSAYPVRQRNPHAPLVHTDVALGRVGHAIPQPPQLRVSEAVNTSHPSPEEPLQSA